jgi:hypothetical protein
MKYYKFNNAEKKCDISDTRTAELSTKKSLITFETEIPKDKIDILDIEFE